MANDHDYFLSRAPFDCGTALRERNIYMVDAGLGRSRAGAGMDYGGADDLLRSRLHLAKPRTDLAGSIAGNGNLIRICRNPFRQTISGEARQERNSRPLAVDD